MKLYDSITSERVSQLALREPVLCRPDESLRQVVGRMRRRHLGCAIVVDDDGKPIGIYTESMLTQLLANNPAGIDDRVSERMSEHVFTVCDTDPVSRVLASLQRENTRFLCVVDGQGKVAGLTGQKGLMEYVADHFPQQVLVNRVGSRPPREREGA